MQREELIPVFSQLGKVLADLGQQNEWPGFQCGLTETEYQEAIAIIQKENFYNPWFTPDSIRKAFSGISVMLDQETLTEFASRYPKNQKKLRVGIVMAGNIPLVGFHDLLCVLLSGHQAVCKLSSSDSRLPLMIFKWLFQWEPQLKQFIHVAAGPMGAFDAVIATGSNNSSAYFEQYFGKYPHIFRKNRTSVAVLTGNETSEELYALGDDCFTYFGMGCRNVSKIFVPEDFDLNRLFEGFYHCGEIVNHHKYANNYDYNRTVYMMNKIPFLDNNSCILKEDEGLHAPLSVVFYTRYKNIEEVNKFLKQHADAIQAIVGRDYIPFGAAQKPMIDDFADGVDTMKFLSEL